MMIEQDQFNRIVALLGKQADDDITWSEGCAPPEDAEEFAQEAIYVICNSGMRFTIARSIYNRVRGAIAADQSAATVFGHAGKARAIDTIWRDRQPLFAAFMAANDKVEFCGTLPWIGGITKYHLAKNFGVDCAKPDVHLQRLADLHGTTPQALCDHLASETGFRSATIDVVLWRACATGVVNSKTGEIVT